MDIKEVLQIVEKHDAVLAFGAKGSKRKVKYIEVMEVPHIDQWNVENTLILTSFYALKDDEQAQIDIINSFIEKKASRIIVKIGRFIDQLPKEAIEMAEKHDFPILLLPKMVPYIDILTPLYQKLHISTEMMLIDHIEGQSYEAVETVLQDIYKSFGLVAYIESLDGELLFHVNQLKDDQWRSSNALFSKPSNNATDYYLNKLNTEFISYRKHACLYSKELKRIIVNLFSKGKRYGLLHIVYTRKQQEKMLLNESVFRLVDKIHITLMGEIIGLQNQKKKHEELLPQLAKDSHLKTLVHIHEKKMFELSTTYTVLEPTLILYGHIEKLLKNMISVRNCLFIENNEKHYVMIHLANEQSTAFEEEWSQCVKESLLQDVQLGVSYPFEECDDLEGKFNIVSTIIPLSEKLGQTSLVYTQKQLGIHSVLLNFTRDKYVVDYVESILKPIKALDEDLVQTLKVYIAENCNATNTAKAMFLNRRTVTYRLKKIREQLGLDLDDAHTIFILQFCFKMKVFL